MPDEFDELAWPASRRQPATASGKVNASVPRLITQIYAGSDDGLRAQILGYLLRPLGSSGLVAIAAGAFAGLLQRRSADGFKVSIDDVSRYTSDQIAELVHFVGQVSPESLQAVASAFTDNPLGIAALSTSAAALLMRALQPTRSIRQGDHTEPDPSGDPASGAAS